LGPSSLAIVVAQPDERRANRTASITGVAKSFDWGEGQNRKIL